MDQADEPEIQHLHPNDPEQDDRVPGGRHTRRRGPDRRRGGGRTPFCKLRSTAAAWHAHGQSSFHQEGDLRHGDHWRLEQGLTDFFHSTAAGPRFSKWRKTTGMSGGTSHARSWCVWFVLQNFSPLLSGVWLFASPPLLIHLDREEGAPILHCSEDAEPAAGPRVRAVVRCVNQGNKRRRDQVCESGRQASAKRRFNEWSSEEADPKEGQEGAGVGGEEVQRVRELQSVIQRGAGKRVMATQFRTREV